MCKPKNWTYTFLLLVTVIIAEKIIFFKRNFYRTSKTVTLPSVLAKMAG